MICRTILQLPLLSLALVLLAATGLTASPTAENEGSKSLTGKETLAGKATDEQRVNNCKVPIEKRGTKPRPDGCSLKQSAPLENAE